jgi:hypothetical protein
MPPHTIPRQGCNPTLGLQDNVMKTIESLDSRVAYFPVRASCPQIAGHHRSASVKMSHPRLSPGQERVMPIGDAPMSLTYL